MGEKLFLMRQGSIKSVNLPLNYEDAWDFYDAGRDGDIEFYEKVSAVYRAITLTADSTAKIPFAIVKNGRDFDTSKEWQNKVGFLPRPKEFIRLARMSLSCFNAAYSFMERKNGVSTLRYIKPTTIKPRVDDEGLIGYTRTVNSKQKDYPVDGPIYKVWRLDHTTELLPSKATELSAMLNAAGILYYSDKFIGEFYKRGGIKPTMLVLKGTASEDTINKIERTWTKIMRGMYQQLGKVFQGVDANGGLEAKPIGDGVDNLKDDRLTRAKISDIAMAIGMPLSLLLANSANYATAKTEMKSWYYNSLVPWAEFMAEEWTESIFKPLGLRFEFRPEQTDQGTEEEVQRAGAWATYVGGGMKPSIAAQVVGIELPQGVEYESLDPVEEPKPEPAPVSSSDTEPAPEEKPAKFIPNIDQLHEMDLWRKIAFRKMKRGESMDFPFTEKFIPSGIASAIRFRLSSAEDEEQIKKSFDLDGIDLSQADETKSYLAIMELAEAINNSVDKERGK